MKYYLLRTIFIIFIAVIVVTGCQNKNRPPYAPYTPSGSSLGLINNAYDYSTLAIDPDGDSIALRFSWEYGDTSAWSSWLATNEEVTMSHSWSLPDSYYIRAQAKDNKENTSEWSLPLIIRIFENLPPCTPSIPSGPSIGYFDSTYQFFSSAIDPDDDSVLIRFDFGDGDTSEWSLLFACGNDLNITHSWQNKGIYMIRTQAQDKEGLISSWSEVHPIIIISIANQPPNIPSRPSGPSDCYLDSCYYFSASAFDMDGDYVAIRFDWDEGDTSDWSDFVPSGTTVTMSYSWHRFTWGNYIHAQAMDMNGITGDWSEGHYITLLR